MKSFRAFLALLNITRALTFELESNSFALNEDKCTAILVGRGATTDKSTMNTHAADCADCDWRINKVPARDWPAGSMRSIYSPRDSYPSWVLEDRGLTWSPKNLEDMSQKSTWKSYFNDVLGHIPQVPHTFALIEG